MFGIFRNKKKKERTTPAIYRKIAGAIEAIHRRWANYLNARINKMTTGSKKISLILFCVLFGSLCLLIGVQAIRNPSNGIRIDKIHEPSHIIQGDNSTQSHRGIIGNKELENIQAFKRYMDSLKKDEKGKALYDSIVTERPGLLDSVNLVESIYKNSKK